MLPPHEIKNKEFSKVIRGYSTSEVDEYMAFMLEKYTELYRENDELERKLKTAEAKLNEFKSDEESIRSALVNAQRASAKIISEANERSDVILRSAKNNCDKLLSDFKKQISRERDMLYRLRTQVVGFKTLMYSQYNEHIELLDKMSTEIPELPDDRTEETLTKKVVLNMKDDLTRELSSETVTEAGGMYSGEAVREAQPAAANPAEMTAANIAGSAAAEMSAAPVEKDEKSELMGEYVYNENDAVSEEAGEKEEGQASSDSVPQGIKNTILELNRKIFGADSKDKPSAKDMPAAEQPDGAAEVARQELVELLTEEKTPTETEVETSIDEEANKEFIEFIQNVSTPAKEKKEEKKKPSKKDKKAGFDEDEEFTLVFDTNDEDDDK